MILSLEFTEVSQPSSKNPYGVVNWTCTIHDDTSECDSETALLAG